MQNGMTKKRSRYATFTTGDDPGYENTVKINPDHVIEFEEVDEGKTMIRTEIQPFVVNAGIDRVEELLNQARM